MAIQFQPIAGSADHQALINAINNINRNLAAEAATKTIQQSGGSAIISGKLSNGRYGDLIYDSNGIPRILVGQKSNGEPIIAVSKPGKDVLKELDR